MYKAKTLKTLKVGWLIDQLNVESLESWQWLQHHNLNSSVNFSIILLALLLRVKSNYSLLIGMQVKRFDLILFALLLRVESYYSSLIRMQVKFWHYITNITLESGEWL